MGKSQLNCRVKKKNLLQSFHKYPVSMEARFHHLKKKNPHEVKKRPSFKIKSHNHEIKSHYYEFD